MTREEFDNLVISNEYESEGFSTTKHKVKRKLFCETKYIDSLESNVDLKYKEVIEFVKTDKISKTAICIGYNPAKASEKIDTTNKRLIDCLWNNYDGYRLINLFPQVSTDKTTCITDLEDNVKFCNVIINILTNEKDDIILFWGRTVAINKDLYDAIIKRIDNKYI